MKIFEEKAKVPKPDDTWAEQLQLAGWVEVQLHTWKSPEGELYRGPFGAWRKMKQAQRQAIAKQRERV